jgi:hypothetical protein
VTPDDGVVALSGKGAATSFIEMCGKLRHWPREAALVS